MCSNDRPPFLGIKGPQCTHTPSVQSFSKEKKQEKKQQWGPPRGCRNSELLTMLMPLSSLTAILAAQTEDEPLQHHLRFKRTMIFLLEKTVLALCSGVGKCHQNTWCYQQQHPSSHGWDLSETHGRAETCADQHALWEELMAGMHVH